MKLYRALLIILLATGIARADYHYASHEGSNEYPYISWETAAWLIQDASNAAEPYDSVYIGVGEYYGLIDMDLADSCIAFIGIGMDSTIIWTDLNAYLIKHAHETSFIDIGFNHYGTYGAVILSHSIFGGPKDLYVNRCKFWGHNNVNAIYGTVEAINIIENCVFDTLQAYDGTSGPELAIFRNNFCSIGYRTSLAIFWVGQKLIAENNIFWVPGTSSEIAIWQGGPIDTLIIRNNLFKSVLVATDMNLVDRGSEFSYNVCDSAYFNPQFQHLLLINRVIADSMHHVDVIGNNFGHGVVGVDVSDVEDFGYGPYASINYNNFWNNNVDILFEIPEAFDSVGNIFSDPMFMGGNDYHLQAFSPLINAGDPEIFDPDGSRSDIGIYGGPLGESYDYIDLPPLAPDSLSGLVMADTIFINWRYNTEADFNRYQLHRDTISGFEPSIFNLIAEPDSSFYKDTDFEFGHDYYYRIAALDNQDNVSDYSEELAVILTDIDPYGLDYPLRTSISGCYPNPFNSRVTINYSVANIGPMPVDIQIRVYDVLGRVVRTIFEGNRYSGEYSVIWDGRDDEGQELSSGVYFAKVIQWEGVLESQPRKIMMLK